MGDIKRLAKTADELFNAKLTLHGLWQEIADFTYPERADFTSNRTLGMDFASNLSNSHQLIARRESSTIMSTMMFPKNQIWAHIKAEKGDDNDEGVIENNQWLEFATKRMREAMYNFNANLTRALTEACNDIWAFGNAVISCEYNRAKQSLLYRCWHLRDMAWVESYDGKICEIYRKSKDSAYNLNKQFKGNVSDKVKKMLEKTPHEMVEYCHAVLPVDRYEASAKIATDYVSVFFECETKHILKEEASRTMIYVVARWETVSGFQYAYSPCSVAALPEIRMLQQLSLMILESTEMQARPPIYGRNEIFRGDINRLAGGITYLDLEPEQRISDAMMFEPSNAGGLQAAAQKELQSMEMINRAYFLDKLKLPVPMSGTTAYEFAKRMEEYIMINLPIFEPLELNFVQPLCEITFDIAMQNGVFGSVEDIPETLQGVDINFEFHNPLQKAIEEQKAQQYIDALGLVSQGAALDPSAPIILKSKIALRDAMVGKGIPAKWLNSSDEIEAIEQQQAQAQQAQQAMAMLQQGGEAAKAVGEGAQAINGIM
jgi:hypothetical protein